MKHLDFSSVEAVAKRIGLVMLQFKEEVRIEIEWGKHHNAHCLEVSI